MRTPIKRAGGRAGDAFRKKLEALIASAGSQRAFARKLWEDVASKSDRSPRVGEWRRGRNLPKADSLQLIASKFDVSIDWLLGFPVPKRRTDRAIVGELGRQLVDHVVRDYARRSVRSRRDGLAHAIGGSLVDYDPPPRQRGAPRPAPRHIGDVLPNGRILVHQSLFSLRVLDVDSQAFLTKICEHVFQVAEQWEADHEESEREAVRTDVRRVAADLDAVREIASHERDEVYKSLLSAALDPLNTTAQAGLVLTKQEVSRKKAVEEAWRDLTHKVIAEAERIALTLTSAETVPTPTLYSDIPFGDGSSGEAPLAIDREGDVASLPHGRRCADPL